MSIGPELSILLGWQFIARRDQRYDDPAFAEAGRQVARDFKDTYAGRCSDIRALYGPLGSERPHDVNWLGKIEAMTTDATLVHDAWEWTREKVWPRIPDASFYFRCSASPAAVCHARWVLLPIAGEYVDGYNRYGIACERCLYPDLDRPPNPFRVRREAVLPTTKSGGEMFKALNSVVIVNRRVMNFLERTIGGGEFDSGSVVDERGDSIDGFYFVRPKPWISSYVREVEQPERCEACRRPMRYEVEPRGPWHDIVHEFGPPEVNIARVGQYARFGRLPRCERPNPTIEDVVISGDLFAALYNLGVKGLGWPWRGAFVSFDGAPPLRSERRFADLFPGKLDRIQKRRRNERDGEIY